jgi:hypothetical protein
MKVGVCEFHQMLLILCISPISKFFVYNTSILYHGHANVNDGIFVFNVLTAFDGFCMSFGSSYVTYSNLIMKSKFKTMNSVLQVQSYKVAATKFAYALVLGLKANKFEVKKIGKLVQILVLELLYKILLCMETNKKLEYFSSSLQGC